MKKLRILKGVLVRTRAHQVLLSFLAFFFAAALVVLLAEPGIETYGDALWYCYAVITTVGFGDLLAKTLPGRLMSVLLSAYAMIALAIITGVIVNFYTQLIQIHQKESIAAVADQLERLPELSKEELTDLSRSVKRLRSSINGGK